jgi:hypothetical protein
MVTQTFVEEQSLSWSRQQKRVLERRQAKERTRLEKLARKTDLPVTFDNETTTAFGGFGMLEAFKQTIGFTGLLQKHLSVPRYHNCRYTATDALVLGLLRLEHMNALKTDPGYRLLKQLDRVPDERTLRHLLGQFGSDDIVALCQVNQTLLELKARTEPAREVWLDFDDTVITLFGKQEGAEVGYNPRYHGRPSHKAKVAFIAGTTELVNAQLYDGKTASNGQFMDFLQETLARISTRTVVAGIRLDKGFFDEKNFSYLEDQSLLYVCKVPLRGNIRKMIDCIDREALWHSLDHAYGAAELEVPLPSWEKPRRFVFIRDEVKNQCCSGQVAMEFAELYDYGVIVTNVDDLPLEEVWRWYNKRANVENKIDELKIGVGLNCADAGRASAQYQNSQHEMLKNEAFMWIKVLAYNLINWFRQALLPEGSARAEMPTIRRLVLNVPGNVVGNGRYRHIQLAMNRWLSEVVSFIKAKLREFIGIKAWLNVLQA